MLSREAVAGAAAAAWVVDRRPILSESDKLC